MWRREAQQMGHRVGQQRLRRSQFGPGEIAGAGNIEGGDDRGAAIQSRFQVHRVAGRSLDHRDKIGLGIDFLHVPNQNRSGDFILHQAFENFFSQPARCAQ